MVHCFFIVIGSHDKKNPCSILQFFLPVVLDSLLAPNHSSMEPIDTDYNAERWIEQCPERPQIF